MAALALLAVLSGIDLVVTPELGYSRQAYLAALGMYLSWPLCAAYPRVGPVLALLACVAAVPAHAALGVPVLTAVVAVMCTVALAPAAWVAVVPVAFLVWAGWAVGRVGGGDSARWGTWLLVFLAAGLGAVLRLTVLKLASTRRRLTQVAAERDRVRRDLQLSIARDLHDVIAYELTLISLTSANQRRETDPAALRAASDEMGRISRSALLELRSMLEVLRDGGAERPEPFSPSRFPQTIDRYVADARAGGLDVHTDLELASWEDVRPAVRTAVLRILQEVLANVLKYAPRGSRCDVAVDLRGTLSLVVLSERAGAGLPRLGAAGGSGYGIVGMRERVDVLGGTLEVGAEDARWAVRVSVPR